MVSKDEELPKLWIAVSGFRATRTYSPEPAGVHYEVKQVRERLSLGQDCSDVLSLSWPKIHKSYSQNGFASLSRNSSAATFDNNDDDETTNNSSSEDDEALFDKEDKAYEKFLKNLDPTKFKDQDHYKVLGLSKLRYQATIKQVKLAYKKKVLNHHPDKRRQKGVEVKGTEEDYFTCISKAYEYLSNLPKRRSYDSVDPTFDENIPSGTLTYKENYFKLYVPAFERNERWSNIQPCPKLGDLNSTAEEVNKFYNFWYNFDSWREFSYLDEEDKEKGENRLERRWIDKQNKASRDKRRKDELKRLRNLVDSAYKNDPRVQKFKDDEKRRKEDERLSREEERRLKQEVIEREKREAIEREEKEKARVEEEARQKQLNEKREKDLAKKALQRERKTLKELCQNNNYFCVKNDDSSLLKRTGHLDQFCQLFSSEQLKSLNDRLKSEIDKHNTNNLSSSINQNCFKIFDEFVGVLEDTLETERRKHASVAVASQNKNSENSANIAVWSTEENQLLIKAMTIFPVGTKSRWDVIAAFINEHSKSDDVNANKKTGKDVVVRVKDVQKLDEKSKESVSKGVPLLQTKANAQVETAPSVRTDSAQVGWEGNPWTSQEQKVLETALKTYPASDAERWDKVAACLPGRSKKDCVKRYKELAEIVRARKVALQQQKEKKPE